MPALERQLPKDLDAERATLGSALQDSRCVPTIESILLDGGAEFSHEPHEMLWRMILDFTRRGIPLDSVPMKDELVRLGQWDKLGGFDFLASLLASVPSALRVATYAQAVREKYILRCLIQTGWETGEIAYSQPFAEACAIADERFAAWSRKRFVSGPRSFAEIVQEVVSTAGDPRYAAVPTGIPPWDGLLGGLVPGEVSIVAAYTSCGKTALAMTIARNIAILGSQPIAWFSNEMSHAATVRRFITMATGVPARAQRKGDLTPDQLERVRRAAQSLEAAPIYLDVRAHRINNICAHVRMLKRRGIVAVFLDYIQNVRGERAENRNIELGYLMSELLYLAKDENLPILCLCQITRDPKKTDKRPHLWNLRDSGNLEQCARMVAIMEPVFTSRQVNEETSYGRAIVHQRDTYEKAVIHIDKNSEGETGAFELSWNAQYVRFECGLSEPEPERPLDKMPWAGDF